MRWGRLLAMAAAFLITAPVSATEAPWPSGLYGNVRVSRQTGDLGGMEAQFFRDGDQPMIEFVWCEGWCNETFTVPLERDGDAFMFSYLQRYADGGVDTGVYMRFRVWREGRNLRVSARQGDESLDQDGKPQVLKPLREAFGIAVVKAGGE